MKAVTVFFLGALALVAQDQPTKRIRVFIGNSDSWETKAGRWGGATGGARNQTPELMKTFSERCGEVTITNDESKADYKVTFAHEGGKGWARNDNKVAVFNRDGDMVFSGSTRSLGSAVKDVCNRIAK